MIAAISLAALLASSNTNPAAPTSPATTTTYEDAELKQGRLAYVSEDYQKAVELLKLYVERKPKSFEGYLYLGLSLRELKQFNEAIAAFEKAVTIKPTYTRAHYELGQSKLTVKNYAAALKEYQWLQEQKEDSWLADELRPYFPAEIAKQYGLPPSPLEQQRVALAAAQPVIPMTSDFRPTITYKEKARYTYDARDHNVQGTVVINIVFSRDGKAIPNGIVRGLPYGLTESAIRAAQKIRFTPVVKDGQPISVRGNVEFNFILY